MPGTSVIESVAGIEPTVASGGVVLAGPTLLAALPGQGEQRLVAGTPAQREPARGDAPPVVGLDVAVGEHATQRARRRLGRAIERRHRVGVEPVLRLHLVDRRRPQRLVGLPAGPMRRLVIRCCVASNAPVTDRTAWTQTSLAIVAAGAPLHEWKSTSHAVGEDRPERRPVTVVDAPRVVVREARDGRVNVGGVLVARRVGHQRRGDGRSEKPMHLAR